MALEGGRMKRASYRDSVRWIAGNDNAGNGDDHTEVSEYITTALIADIFGTDVDRVATDVMRERAKEQA